MGYSTWSGPIRSGTIKNGPAANVGLVVLSQQGDVAFGNTSGSPASVFTLPVGARVLSFKLIVTEAFNASTNNTITLVADGDNIAQLVSTGEPIDVGVYDVPILATADAVAAVEKITADTSEITAVFAGTGTAANEGEAVVTVEYVQRSPDGSFAPAVN